MKTIKVSEATNAQLDWLVYECEKREGRTDVYMRWFCDGRKDAPWCNGPFRPSTDWSQGGPIIDKMVRDGLRLMGYTALPSDPTSCQAQIKDVVAGGRTPLIAAMRCYVASKLGESVEVPEELA